MFFLVPMWSCEVLSVIDLSVYLNTSETGYNSAYIKYYNEADGQFLNTGVKHST